MIVTIDGPAGTGKSTAARALAERLGFQYLDTGAMYRAVALSCLRQQVDWSDTDSITAVAHAVRLRMEGSTTFLNDEDVTPLLRTAEVTAGASVVAQLPGVRGALVERQREIAAIGDWVCEGRDQGTVVFPYAERKFYLTADPRIRAERRQRELKDKGENVSLELLLEQQTDRDRRDSERDVSPLRAAEDAREIDTTTIVETEVVERLAEFVRGPTESPKF